MITSKEYGEKMEALRKEGIDAIKARLEKLDGQIRRLQFPYYAETVLGMNVVLSMIYLNEAGSVIVKGTYDDSRKPHFEGSLKFDIKNYEVIPMLLSNLENNK